ncbi:UNVERIFIED_ORG: hypothetical protein J2X79_000222 [Arthrobacter globiformis]|nr:hypothetical protein [Arthrobacter globiformis]
MESEHYVARLGALNAAGPDGFSRRTSAMPTREITITDEGGQTAYTARTADTPDAADRHIKAGGFRRVGDWSDGVCSVERVPASEKRRKRIIVAAASVAAFVVVVAGCGALASAGQNKPAPSASAAFVPPFTASGTLTVESTTSIQRDIVNVFDDSENNCQPTGGYKDLAIDTKVVITGNGGSPVAVGRIKNGKQSAKPKNCVLTWEVAGVPAGHFSYTVMFGHRPPVELSETELRSGYDATIGDGQ